MDTLDISREATREEKIKAKDSNLNLTLNILNKDIKSGLKEFTESTTLKEFSRLATNHTINNLLANGLLLLKHEDFGLAENLFSKVLREDCYNLMAIKGLAQAYRGQGCIEQAIKCSRSALDLGYCFNTKASLAEMYYESGQLEQALACYEELLSLPVEEGYALFNAYKNIGNIWVRSGDLDIAEEFYNKAYAMDPESDVLFVNLGTLEIQRGQLAAALERFRQAVSLNFENDKAWVGLAMIHREFSDRDLAWANIERALDVNIDNETAIRLAVDWAFNDGRIPEMIDRLELYLSRNQEDLVMRFVLAKMLVVAGRYLQGKLEMEILDANGFVHDEFQDLFLELTQKVNEIYK